jgi:hypothetical protein
MRNDSNKIPRKSPRISEESNPRRLKEKVKGRKSTIKNKQNTALPCKLSGPVSVDGFTVVSSCVIGPNGKWVECSCMPSTYSLNKEAPFEAEVLVWNPQNTRYRGTCSGVGAGV